ncbi:hypothetical protein V6N11_049954 [Hibiscus sabdariffa]|uniref:Uncharacterized protein n=1 Tax=Hibiscus sabdariffa TaxID=183260 RepID=A0ABR2T903_9ROSI
MAKALLVEIQEEKNIMMFNCACPMRSWSSVRATSRLNKDFEPSSYVLRSEYSNKELEEGHNVENDRDGNDDSEYHLLWSWGKRKYIDPFNKEKKKACLRKEPITIVVETTLEASPIPKPSNTFGKSSKYAEVMMETSKALRVITRVVKSFNKADNDVNVTFT